MTTRQRPQPRAGIRKIRPYQQGASTAAGVAQPIKLSSNESALGPSPRAIDAYVGESGNLHRYPDGSQQALRDAIAQVHGLPADRIVCGNGSDELIQLVTRAFVGESDEVLLSENSFLMCRIHALAQNAGIVVAPERDDRIDVDALLARVSDRTRLLPIANPNNPTGTYVGIREIERLHAGLPGNVILLLDGAYAEYVAAQDYDAGAKLVLDNDNVVMTRTFSKIYGLSALRIGWALMPGPVLDAVQRIRTPFNANGPAMAAATAAVLDVDYTATVRGHNARSLAILRRGLESLGLQVVPSVTNFYLVRFPAGIGLTAAEAVDELLSRGIIPRPMGDESDPELRITVGSDDENAAVIEAFAQMLAEPASASGG